MRYNQYNSINGFTLIEIMIVIAVIGILAAIAIPQFSAYRERSFSAAASEADARITMDAIAEYFEKHGSNQIPAISDLPKDSLSKLRNQNKISITGEPNKYIEVIVEGPGESSYMLKAIISESIPQIVEAPIADRIYKKLSFGHAAVSAPKEMNLKDTERVHLIVSLKKKLDDLKKNLPKEHTIKGAQIRISDRMQASLHSLDFRISEESPKIQTVHSYLDTKWSWLIKAKRVGEHELIFTLCALGQINDLPTSIALETYREKVIVNVGILERCILYLKGNAHWIYPIIAVLFGILTYVIGFVKGKRKK